MAGLPSDICAQVAKALASGDKHTAADLAGKIAAAQASGAHGFDDDLAALQRLAGVPVTKIRPLAEQALAKALAAPLPADVAARVLTVEAMAKAAQSPAELCAAKAAIDRLTSDIRTDVALKALLSTPKTFGVCPS